MTISVAQTRTCVLSSCPIGCRARVVDVGGTMEDACQLRVLGMCEGADVHVIDSQHGMLLNVRGTRLALGAMITEMITVQVLPE